MRIDIIVLEDVFLVTPCQRIFIISNLLVPNRRGLYRQITEWVSATSHDAVGELRHSHCRVRAQDDQVVMGSTSKTPTIRHTRVAPLVFRRSGQNFMSVDSQVLFWHVFPQDSQCCRPGGHGTQLGGHKEGASLGQYARWGWRKVRSISSSFNHLFDM